MRRTRPAGAMLRPMGDANPSGGRQLDVISGEEAGAHEFEVESRWEAAPAVAAIVLLQVALAMVSKTQGWTLWHMPWWSWLLLAVPELVLLIGLAWSRPRAQLEQLGHRRTAALVLIALISVGNAATLLALIASVLSGHEQNGGELLFKGITTWSTNVITFGLGYWALDRGGPVRRREPDPPPADFQFPQMDDPQLAEPGWHPRLFDYIYVSFTNAIAFSPTDTMPLTRRAKALMMLESAASAITILLVAARAVNILK
jgi:uncharacterized membrane protein